MRLAVIDTETTGISETDRVLEVAVVVVPVSDPTNHDLWFKWSSLVKPECKISAKARATHHITDDELAKAPTMKWVYNNCLLPMLDDDFTILIGHYLDFDTRMLAQSDATLFNTQRICTWQCSKHLYPDVEGHGNQVLRYELGLSVPKFDLPPHRALPDALVTASLFVHMLKDKWIEELIRLSTTPVLLKMVDFGKYRGKAWADIKDISWLRWITTQNGPDGFSADKLHTAKFYFDKLVEEIKRQREKGYRLNQVSGQSS